VASMHTQWQVAKVRTSAEQKLLTLPMADRTTTGNRSGKLQMMSATSFIRSASRTDEPPNLYTTLSWRVGACKRKSG